MPFISKYSDHDIETLINQILNTLKEKNASTEMSLMVLGDAVSHIINTNIAPLHKKELAQKFCTVLTESIK